MINKEFEKWAKGYSGFDGGNPNGKIWLCGIEWGGESPTELEEIKKLFDEDVSEIPTGYINHNVNLDLPKFQYNYKFLKVMSTIKGENFLKNGSNSTKIKEILKKFNDEEKCFTKDSNYLKLNLLPFNFPNVDKSNWNEMYESITGHKTKKEYMSWSLEERFKMFQGLLQVYSPTLIITVGKTYFENYKNAFGYSKEEFTVKKFECKNNKEYKYFHDEINNRLIINLPFFSGRYGLNSNCLLIETGKIIKKLLEDTNINIELGE